MGRREWGGGPKRSGGLGPRVRILILGGVGFVLTTGVAALIGEAVTDTYHRVTSPSSSLVKVSLALSRSAPGAVLDVRAMSSRDVGSVTAADGYLFQRSVDELAAPPDVADGSCEPWRVWAKDAGGIDVGATLIEIYVSGGDSGPIILDRAEIEIVERAAPVRGAYALCPIQYMRLYPRLLDIDLDQSRPSVDYTTEKRLGLSRRHRPFRFSLEPGETEDFQILARTERHYVAWRLRLGYVADGKRHEITVSDRDGRPFETSSSTNASEIGYSSAEGWEVVPPRTPLGRSAP